MCAYLQRGATLSSSPLEPAAEAPAPATASEFICEGRLIGCINVRHKSTSSGLALAKLADGTEVLAVSDWKDCCITVYGLPAGAEVRTFGCKGSGRGQFHCPRRICASPDGTLLVAEDENRRIQEITVEGEHRRFIGMIASVFCYFPIRLAMR